MYDFFFVSFDIKATGRLNIYAKRMLFPMKIICNLNYEIEMTDKNLPLKM